MGRKELGSPNQGGPGKRALGCPVRLGWAAEKGTKPQPSCHLEQGATFSSSFCLVHEKKR